MDWLRAVGLLTTAAIATSTGGLAASLVVGNDLLRGSENATAALAVLLLTVAFIGGLVALGRPGGRWRRTPYW